MRRMVEQSLWMQQVAKDPGHSQWYVERFRTMEREGKDVVGEARFIDAMAARGSRILDAGCGAGRIAGYLASVGHDVVGVDVDPVLVAAAEKDHPGGPRWLVNDLAELDLPARGIDEQFDIIVSAGNVMTFLAPEYPRHRADAAACAFARQRSRGDRVWCGGETIRSTSSSTMRRWPDSRLTCCCRHGTFGRSLQIRSSWWECCGRRNRPRLRTAAVADPRRARGIAGANQGLWHQDLPSRFPPVALPRTECPIIHGSDMTPPPLRSRLDRHQTEPEYHWGLRDLIPRSATVDCLRRHPLC